MNELMVVGGAEGEETCYQLMKGKKTMEGSQFPSKQGQEWKQQHAYIPDLTWNRCYHSCKC